MTAISPAGGAPLAMPAPPAGPTPEPLPLIIVPSPDMPLPPAELPPVTDPAACRFVVYGVPVTQAGMRAVPTPAGYRQVTTGGKGLLPWRQAIARTARAAADAHGPFADTPVVITLDFRFPMPKTRTKAQRRTGIWFHRGRRDDIDKLERAVLDGLAEGGLIADDGNVVEVHKRKREYVDGWLGVDVTVRPADLVDRPL